MKGVAFLSCVTLANGQAAGTLVKEKHPQIDYHVCGKSGCKKHTTGLVIDSNWRYMHVAAGTKDYDVYTPCFVNSMGSGGNVWDEKICPDEATCSKNCVIDGADNEYEGTWGVKTKADELSLQFVTEGPFKENVGSRLYMTEGEDKYKMFHLKNREFTFTVDDSDVGCGLNGALYLVQMEEDGGASKYKNAGAKYGTGYCDAQCPHDMKWIHGRANVVDWVPSFGDDNAGSGKYGTCCTEIDLWEANKHAMAFTMHACDHQDYRCSGKDCGDNGADRFNGVCDKNGCDIQHNRFPEGGAAQTFYGAGDQFKINANKKVTVTTQFITADGTDSGKLTEVKQFYTQDGKTFDHPPYSINGKKHNSITNDMCKDWVADTKDMTNFLEKGGLQAVDDALTEGAVLVMSFWDDHQANMLWLDSMYPTDADPIADKGSYRGPCSITSGNAKNLEKNVPDSTVRFSGIKWGPLGSTVARSDDITV